MRFGNILLMADGVVVVVIQVISILQHVNTRIKPPYADVHRACCLPIRSQLIECRIRSIKLPLPALLKQFKDPNSTSLIRHFDLLYIQQGTGRIPPAVSSLLFQLSTQKYEGRSMSDCRHRKGLSYYPH